MYETFWPGSCLAENNLDIYAWVLMAVDVAQQSPFTFFFQAVKIRVPQDNILGIETTLACLADCKKILITCTHRQLLPGKPSFLQLPTCQQLNIKYSR